MKKIMLCALMFCIPFYVLSQEKLTKKEIRQQRKLEKEKEQHLKLIEAAKDSSWSYFPYKITSAVKSGNDGGMFTFVNMRMTLLNIFIPNAKDTDQQKRISSYDGQVLNYGYQIDASKEIKITLVFQYKGTIYSFLLVKPQNQKWAVLKILEKNRLLATYEGPLKQ